jgi:hypothetical protein
MGFNGGGTGSFVLPDHTHTATDEDGGVLDADGTLVDAATLEAFVDSRLPAVATRQDVTVSGSQTFVTNDTFEDVTGLAITMPNNTNKSLVVFTVEWLSAAVGGSCFIRLVNDGVAEDDFLMQVATAGRPIVTTLPLVVDNDGQIIKVQATRTSSITLTTRDTCRGTSLELT